MPANPRGSVFACGNGYGIRWPEHGKRPQKTGFRTRREANRWFSEHVAPRLLTGGPSPEITFDAFCAVYLARHGGSERTRETQRERLARARAVFGTWSLRELEGAAADIAAWRASLPTDAMRYRMTRALREVLAKAMSWGYLSRNPAVDAGRNPEPQREELQPFTPGELAAICAELDVTNAALVTLACEAGLRTGEWAALERRDVDRSGAVPALRVERQVVRGQVKPYPKTARSRRRVLLTSRALAALDQLHAQLASPLLFPAPEGGYLLLDNWRSRDWYPALEAAGVRRRGPYHLRHTFASESLAAGMHLWHLARVMGSSLREVDRTYGHLVRDSEASIVAVLEVRSALRPEARMTEGSP